MTLSKNVKTVARKKILVIEDEPLLASMYKAMLRDVQADVYGARTKQEAEQIIARVRPDLILLDLMIPSSSSQDLNTDFHNPVGLKLLAQMRKRPETKKEKVIILSNLDADEYRNRAITLGATDYLIKASHAPGEVAKRVKQVLQI